MKERIPSQITRQRREREKETILITIVVLLAFAALFWACQSGGGL